MSAHKTANGLLELTSFLALQKTIFLITLWAQLGYYGNRKAIQQVIKVTRNLQE